MTLRHVTKEGQEVCGHRHQEWKKKGLSPVLPSHILLFTDHGTAREALQDSSHKPMAHPCIKKSVAQGQRKLIREIIELFLLTFHDSPHSPLQCGRQRKTSGKTTTVGDLVTRED